MAKVKKADLDKLTTEAMRIAGTTMALLISTRCPYRQEYEEVEGFVREITQFRAILELPSISDKVENAIRREPIGFRYEA